MENYEKILKEIKNNPYTHTARKIVELYSFISRLKLTKLSYRQKLVEEYVISLEDKIEDLENKNRSLLCDNLQMMREFEPLYKLYLKRMKDPHNEDTPTHKSIIDYVVKELKK